MMPNIKHMEAETITQKLESFWKDNQKYPQNLDALKPYYIRYIWFDIAYESHGYSYTLSYERRDIFGFEYWYMWYCNQMDCMKDFFD